MLKKLQDRWQLKSTTQVVVVLIVFACTGFTIMFLKKPIVSAIAGSEEYSTFFSVLYYVFILPVYNVVLLIYGFLFGQFAFFWEFEKKMWRRMTGKKTNHDAE
ncbi:MAG: prolipoprotein diacylglyceryl transferase [Cytophagales bacterium]|nr:prolipoprotein diacylglyceryl transferase [Cytophagales bacterium]